jgi:hypothetical protein
LQIERIKTLEVQMIELIGNGQPGRVGKAEKQIEDHARLIWIGIGGISVLQFIIAARLFKFF